MKERALIYLVVVLVVINVAALGTIIYQRVTGPFWMHERPEGMMTPSDMPREFKLQPDQRRAMRESRLCVDSLIAPIHSQIAQKRQELLSEMDSGQPDSIRIDQILTEIGALQVQVEKTMIRHLLEDSKNFSPEQRSAFLRMINQRAKWQDRPMMGPGQEMGRGRR
jgi:Spy/CpxP family protein refolding chaperone